MKSPSSPFSWGNWTKLRKLKKLSKQDVYERIGSCLTSVYRVMMYAGSMESTREAK